jgi:hypothetical protein
LVSKKRRWRDGFGELTNYMQLGSSPCLLSILVGRKQQSGHFWLPVQLPDASTSDTDAGKVATAEISLSDST